MNDDRNAPRRFEHHVRHQTPKSPVKPHHFVAENGKRSFSANGADVFLEFKYWRLVDHLYCDLGKGDVSFAECAEVAFKGMPKPVDAALWLKSSRFDINEALRSVGLQLEISDSGAHLVELG